MPGVGRPGRPPIDPDGSSAAAVQAAIDAEAAARAVADALDVQEALYDAHTIIYATTDNTPAALTVGASTVVGRKATGNISAMSVAETKTLLAIGESDVTNLTTDLAAKVDKTTLDANSVLYAVTDNTPAALALGASTIVARLASGNVVAATVAEIKTLLALTLADIAAGTSPAGTFTFGTAANDALVLVKRDNGAAAFSVSNDADQDITIAVTATGAGTKKSAIYTNTAGGLSFGTEGNVERVYVDSAGLRLTDAHDVVISATTGSKIGQAGSKIGFFGKVPAAQPTGVAVTAEAVHAALVALGLITA